MEKIIIRSIIFILGWIVGFENRQDVYHRTGPTPAEKIAMDLLEELSIKK